MPAKAGILFLRKSSLHVHSTVHVSLMGKHWAEAVGADDGGCGF